MLAPDVFLGMARETNSRRGDGESGVTLIELLIVILIIGILAAIALPAFLGQQAKATDANAKSNARELLSEVESCYITTEDYSECMDPSGTGLPLAAGGTVPAAQSVSVLDASDKSGDGFTIVARSKSTAYFSIARGDGGGALQRTCTTAGTGQGGCNGGTW
jgi:type IV pilus assembly protein PilA